MLPAIMEGVPITRTIAFGGLHWVPLILGMLSSDTTPMMEKQAQEKLKNEWETGIYRGHMCCRLVENSEA